MTTFGQKRLVSCLAVPYSVSLIKHTACIRLNLCASICSAKFLVEEDEEGMKKELREAFRIYDKEGNGYIPTSALKVS